MQLGTCLETPPACRVWTSDLSELCSPVHTSWSLGTQSLHQSNSHFHHFSVVKKKKKEVQVKQFSRHIKEFRKGSCASNNHVKFSTLRLLVFFQVEFSISI